MTPLQTRYKHVTERTTLPLETLNAVSNKIAAIGPIKRVLLVNVPQIPESTFDAEAARQRRYPCFPPYGLGLLAAVLKGAGYEVALVDLHFALLDGVSYPNLWTVLAEAVGTKNPDVIGLSCMFNMGHEPLRQVSKWVGRMWPDAPVIAGGVHPSLCAAEVLDDVPEIDFVVMHEADDSLLSFLTIANGGTAPLPSVATRVDDRVIRHVSPAAPPTSHYSPDYGGLPIERYSQVGRIGAYTFLRPDDTVAATVLSRRGCRAQCSFCSVRTVNGPGVRVRDASAVVDELMDLQMNYGVRHVMWLDDDLFYDREHAVAMLNTMATRVPDMTWDASNGVIAAALTRPLLDACVRSGCVGFNLGIESGNREILAHMRKPGTIESFVKAADMLHDYPSIFTKGFLVFGYPGETVRALQDTVDLARRMDFDWYPSQILTPMPGTPVAQLMAAMDASAGTATEAVTRSRKLGQGRTFSVGATGSIGRREREEKTATRPFANPLDSPPDYVPTREEIEDVWVVADYRINYKPILTQPDLRKVEKKRLMLREICDRMTSDNPLGWLFLGVCCIRLGEPVVGGSCVNEARRCLAESAFWQVRFAALGIDQVMEEWTR